MGESRGRTFLPNTKQPTSHFGISWLARLFTASLFFNAKRKREASKASAEREAPGVVSLSIFQRK